jgi:1-acyl-sn-glycerol-3-phosphate acyltransferase
MTGGAGAPAWPAKWRAAWRLVRALVHAASGLAVVTLVFPWLGRRAREAAIGRWARGMFAALGIGIEQRGGFGAGAKLVVANHVSWLDVMAVHASCPEARFVAMAEVLRWPGVPRLVRSAGTLFLERRRLRDLLRVVHDVTAALRAGDTVAVFPEGVVSDGEQLLEFHGNLLQSAIDAAVPLQAVALRYLDAHGRAAQSASRATLFTGDITLGQSLWRLACAEDLRLHVRVLPQRAPRGEHRRVLAAQLGSEIAAALGCVAPAPIQAPAGPAPRTALGSAPRVQGCGAVVRSPPLATPRCDARPRKALAPIRHACGAATVAAPKRVARHAGGVDLRHSRAARAVRGRGAQRLRAGVQLRAGRRLDHAADAAGGASAAGDGPGAGARGARRVARPARLLRRR